jgi:uncharacterized protein (TIGR04141 family)
MTKTRSFSIFLLKESFDSTNALEDDNDLESGVAGDKLPEGAVLYVLDNPPRDPWWKGYFGLQKELKQASKGALVFLPVNNRWFAISFGHVFHNLKDASYEYDFGLRVTLNCVDPDKLKSTDTLEPSGAKRQRTQLPTVADLTFFDLDTDSAILKSLTGKVKDEYKGLFKHATGSSNIHVSSEAAPADLKDLCTKLLELYQDETYKTAFPDIQNISPVRDPVVIEKLNANLVTALRTKDDAISLSVPEIQDYGDGLWGTFSGVRAGKIYDDIFIGGYYEYLAEASVDLSKIGIEELKKHQLKITDEDGQNIRDQHHIFNCLIFDTTLDEGTQAYHLCEGHWYLIDTNYVAKLENFLDPLCKDTTLPDFLHKDEGEFNSKASEALEARLCLDKTNIAPNGQKQVEPCDIFEFADGKAVFHHIKISTLSAQLSHLFNQGTNSVKLLRADAEAMTKLEALITAKAGDGKGAEYIAPLKANKLKVSFGIITHKNKADKSLNLPLFSRISLMRCMKELKVMGIEAEFGFIADTSPKREGKEKKRKSKKADEE